MAISEQTAQKLKDMQTDGMVRPLLMAEISDLNLLDNSLPQGLLIHKSDPCDHRDRFFLRKGYREWITAPLRQQELIALEALMRQYALHYKVEHYPPHYWKDQGNKWSIGLELSTLHLTRRAKITLVEFGCSYGTIRINDEVDVTISHSGGTGGDMASCFHLVGDKRFVALKSLILAGRDTK